MKQLILLFLTCCCLFSAKASTDANSDSLVQVLQTLPRDTNRLSTLSAIIKIEQHNNKCIQYSDSLMKDALLQKNDKYAGLAAYYHVVYFYNQNEQDSVAKWMNRMEPYVRKSSGLWDYYFDAKRFQIDLYSYDLQYERAINEANKMMQQALNMKNNSGLVAAHQCLSNAYIGSQRWDKGVSHLEKAYRLLTSKDSAVTRISVLTQLVSATKELKDNDKQLQYMKELESVLKKYIKDNPSLKESYEDVFLFNELFYAYYYLNTNHPNNALEHLNKAKIYMTKNTYFMYKILYFDTLGRYYKHIGEYQQASDCIDTTLVMLKADFPSDYAEQLLTKARIWVRSGQSEKAVPFYQEALAIKDSAAMTLTNTQMQQIKSAYKMDKMDLEQQKQNNQILLICLVVIVIILVILFTFMSRLFIVRRALKHSEKEVRKAAETVRKTNEIKNRFLSNMSYNIRTPLNNVVGFSQLIASEPNIDQKTREEYSDIIHKSSDKLMRLVNDVLDLSRLEAQMMKFQIQVYDAVALCNEACYMAHMKNETIGIQIEFSTDIESQLIRTDTTRLTQALLSTLVYPKEHQEKRIIRFTLTRDENNLCFRIINSPLADRSFISQETIIRHDINLLLLKYFEGSYLVNEKASEESEIVFIYPSTFE